MMMMMNELTLTWHIVLRLQGHVTVKEESRSSQCGVDGTQPPQYHLKYRITY